MDSDLTFLIYDLPKIQNQNNHACNIICNMFLASPVHVSRKIDEIDIPNEAMASVFAALEKLVAESQITMDLCNRIVFTRKMPIELAQYLGLDVQCGTQQIPTNTSTIPVSFNRGFFVGCSSSGLNSPNYGTASPNHHITGNLSTSQNFSTFETNSASQSPIHYNLSGTTSPNPYLNTATASPMHQITKGISGLTTGTGSAGGSITRGTSLASETASNQPLDLTTTESRYVH